MGAAAVAVRIEGAVEEWRQRLTVVDLHLRASIQTVSSPDVVVAAAAVGIAGGLLVAAVYPDYTGNAARLESRKQMSPIPVDVRK